MSNERFPALVVKVIDEYKVVINRGSNDNIKVGQRFLIYRLEEEIFDPVSNESLGFLEIVKGTGRVIHVQEKIATIESDKFDREKKIVKKRNHPGLLLGGVEVEEITPRELLPFEDPEIGDKAKPV